MTNGVKNREERIKLLDFNTNVSSRYHMRLFKYYDGLSRWIATIGLATSSGVFASLVASSSNALTPVLTFVSALAALSRIVERGFSFGKKVEQHRILYKRFVELSAKLQKIGPNTSQEEIDEYSSQYLLIESDEPPIKLNLAAICRHEVSILLNREIPDAKITKLRRTIAYFW